VRERRALCLILGGTLTEEIHVGQVSFCERVALIGRLGELQEGRIEIFGEVGFGSNLDVGSTWQ
jgi:hypothetical protein